MTSPQKKLGIGVVIVGVLYFTPALIETLHNLSFAKAQPVVRAAPPAKPVPIAVPIAPKFVGSWGGFVVPSNRDRCNFTVEINQHPEIPNKLFAYSRLDCSSNLAVLYLQNRLSDPAAKKFLPESTISSADVKDGRLSFDITSNIGSGCPTKSLAFTPFGSNALSAEFEDECGHGDLILKRAR